MSRRLWLTLCRGNTLTHYFMSTRRMLYCGIWSGSFLASLPPRIGFSNATKWTPHPNTGWLKLNFDRSSRGKLGRAGECGVIRDSCGSPILSYVANLEIQNSSMVEGAVVYHGLIAARENGLNCIIIKGDLRNTIMILKRMVKLDWKTNPHHQVSQAPLL